MVPASTASNAWPATPGEILGTSMPAAMSVSMKEACTATTSVPWRASSVRIPLVRDSSAAFDAP